MQHNFFPLKAPFGAVVALLFPLIHFGTSSVYATPGSNASLEQDFAAPPHLARPMVWWHWMGNNVSKEGITADLESMKTVGISEATIFNIGSYQKSEGNPAWKNNSYRSPEWWALVEHAVKEAKRLGITLGMQNCIGYSGSGGPWVTPEKAMKKVVWSTTPVKGETAFSGKLPQPETKLGFYREIGVVAIPDGAEAAKASVLDLTGSMQPDGTFNWTAPAGAWTVYRFGYTATGALCDPAPANMPCLQCDKLSAEDSRFNFEQVLAPLKAHLGAEMGKTFRQLTFDSYEAGALNWNEKFRAEFQKRRGYDPVIWLPTLDKRVIASAEQSTRFAWDMKTTVSELFVENNFAVGRAMLNAAGLKMYLEPYTSTRADPLNPIASAGTPDVTMGEYWIVGRGSNTGRHIVGPAQAAGQTIIACESFTAHPGRSRWSETPAELKIYGDEIWVNGVNQIYLHGWVHQPFSDQIKPGMTMGWWGTHFGRNQTWNEPGKAWFSYLARSQALLQRGEPVSDYLVLDHNAPLGANRPDVIGFQDFLAQASVKDGRILLPSKRTYAFLQVADQTLTPATARKIRELVQAGAVVAGTRPERSPSGQDFPKADEEVAAIGHELWGDNLPHRFGQGQVFANVGQALAALKIGPDFSAQPAMPKLMFTHRRDGESEIYFLTSGTDPATSFTASFRVAGKVPELWNPETGTRADASNWEIKEGRTEVKMNLEANTSVFVVFKKPTTLLTKQAPPTPDPAQLPQPLTLEGPWEVHFEAGRGAPEQITLPTLASWSTSDQPGVKYFSGTAKYIKTIEVPAGFLGKGRTVELDLGVVKELARVIVNGKECGVAWHAPFKLDITSALKPGRNQLVIEITNTWANRLIGDEQEPEDAVFGPQKDYVNKNEGRHLTDFPDWLIQGKPRPTKRIGFCTFDFFTKDSPLLPAGLLGPVQLRSSLGQVSN